MSYLLIANIFSFGSACFTVASSWTKKVDRTYGYQVGQCLMYAAASFFFGIYAGIVIMLVSAFRNYLIAKGKYTQTMMIICSLASLVLGLAVNGGSLAGYIGIFATVTYAVASFYIKEAKAVKVNVAVDLMLWMISDYLIRDIPSGIIDVVGIITAVIAIFRIRKDEKRQKLSE